MPAHISELGKHNRRTQEQARSHNEHIHVSAKNISEEHHPSKSISLSPIDPMNSTPEKSTVPQVRARKLGANLGDAERVLSNSPHHTREPNPQLACLPGRHSNLNRRCPRFAPASWALTWVMRNGSYPTRPITPESRTPNWLAFPPVIAFQH